MPTCIIQLIALQNNAKFTCISMDALTPSKVLAPCGNTTDSYSTLLPMTWSWSSLKQNSAFLIKTLTLASSLPIYSKMERIATLQTRESNQEPSKPWSTELLRPKIPLFMTMRLATSTSITSHRISSRTPGSLLPTWAISLADFITFHTWHGSKLYSGSVIFLEIETKKYKSTLKISKLI